MLNHLRYFSTVLLIFLVLAFSLSSCGGGGGGSSSEDISVSVLSSQTSSVTILYGAFPGYGLWKHDGTIWSCITPDGPEGMAAEGTIFYGDFGTLGLWKYDGANWSLLTPDNPENIVASESALYGDFGALGLRKYDGSAWSRLTSDNPQTMAASGSNFYGGSGVLGLWKYDGTSWSWLTSDNPENITASGSILYGDFGTLGLWKYDGTNWSQLTPDNPENITASGSILYGDFGTLGLWKYDGTNWSQLTPDNPENIAASGSTLFGDFGALGFWKHDGTSWSWLTSDNPSVLCATTQSVSDVVPAAPSGLTAAALSSSSIELNWVDNSDNETKFEIWEYVSDSQSPLYVDEVGANITIYARTGLQAATTYYYQIRVCNAAGCSQSNTASATTIANVVVPAAPSGLTAAALSSSSIELNWVDNSNDEAYFEIWESTSTSDYANYIGQVGPNVTAYTRSGLLAATTYYYYIKACNTAGCSQSNTISSTTVTVIAIASGGYHTLALKSDGTVWAWGLNGYGQLGDGTNTDSLIPVQVSGLTGIIAIAAGEYHSLALTSSGGVKDWGGHLYGEDGAWTSYTPVDVSGLTSGVKAITAGWRHSLALTTSGGVKAWGSNLYGQLGDGTTTKRLTPVDVTGLTAGADAIASGIFHSFAVTTSGGAKAWGDNFTGQLGDGTTTKRLTPVNVTGLTSGVKAIAAGRSHSLALTTSGGVKAWGENYGQLGDGTTTNRLTPVNVTGLTTGVKTIAAGQSHSLALTNSGGVKAWGSNACGQLGDGTRTNRLTPVDVNGLSSGISDIAGGGERSFALTGSGGVKAWGNNSWGGLGDGSTEHRDTPVDVTPF